MTLTATPDPGWLFGSWLGYPCSASPCNLSMTSDLAVIARFVSPVSGGTSFGNSPGQSGMSCIYNPTVLGGTIPFVDVRGPAGWNGGNPFRCNLYQPPGIALNRSIAWQADVAPFTGDYIAEGSVGGQVLSAQFSVDASSQLADPQVTSVTVASNQVTVQWTASPDARSFLVRVNPIPFTGITGEMVVGGEARSLTLTGLSLASGGQYQAGVFAFSKDVKTPGDMDGQFNISAHSVTFQAP